MPTSIMDRDTLRDIHRYWFGELKSPDDFPEDRTEIWFRQSDETDRHIRETFGRFIPEAAATAWDVGRLAREEGVALVVLFDQFPRNIFRDSAEAFAYDARAREIALALIATGRCRFFWVERAALAIPFEHSEDMADQDYAVMICAELAISAPERLREFCRDKLDYATKHRDIIRKFSRFPHRNAVLGRQSTPEEAAFVAAKGRGY
jgi:uncharacterized protein (DUF924 family)